MSALINRKAHRIGGVEFRNPRKFQLLAATVVSSAMEGWEPTEEEIRLLGDAYEHPQHELDGKLDRLRHWPIPVAEPAITDEKTLNRDFLYPNGTLKNKLGIQDKADLDEHEFMQGSLVGLRILQRGFKVDDVDDLCRINKALFGDLYAWAGKLRNYNLTKQQTLFLPPNVFDNGIRSINTVITDLKEQTLPQSAAYARLLDELNYLHPFREGNGRAIRIFIELLANEKGQYLYYDDEDDEFIQALYDSKIEILTHKIHLTALAAD